MGAQTAIQRAVRLYPPRLMPLEDAAYYLGIGRTMLLKKGPAPKRDKSMLGDRVLWDRLDLDRWADRLDGQPLDDASDEAEAKDVERRFLESRRGRG